MRRSPRGQNHEVTSEDQGYLEFQKGWEKHEILLGNQCFVDVFFGEFLRQRNDLLFKKDANGNYREGLWIIMAGSNRWLMYI